jgi:hypothetical protein
MASNHYDNGESFGELVKEAAAGVIGGMAGAWAMNRFQALLKAAAAHCPSHEQSASEAGSGQAEQRHQAQSSGGGGEPATVKLAETVSREVFHHPLSRQEKRVAGPAVHYGYGAAVGGVYGALGEVLPVVTMGAGLPYAAALWLLGDEVAVPLLGLSKVPSQYPLSTHASALASHLVYGLVLELTRRTVREAL